MSTGSIIRFICGMLGGAFLSVGVALLERGGTWDSVGLMLASLFCFFMAASD